MQMAMGDREGTEIGMGSLEGWGMEKVNSSIMTNCNDMILGLNYLCYAICMEFICVTSN